MSFEIQWYQPKRIILGRFEGNIAVQDMNDGSKAVTQYLSEGEAPIHIIFDVSAMKKFPTNILQLKRDLTYIGHPTLKCNILIGSTALVNSLANILSQVSKLHLKTFKTVAQGVEFLRQEDPSLFKA